MPEDDATLLAAAMAGDRAAMGVLLMRHDVRLRRCLARWIGTQFQASFGVEDVIQDAYTEAYRNIRRFEPTSEASFQAWLITIAQRQYLNARRKLFAEKRGAGRRAAPAKDNASSLIELVNVLDGRESTPSRKAGRGEAVQLVRVALAGIKDEYRQALRMRYIEGRPVQEIAAAMDRTEPAVHMLCHRALRVLRDRMGSASKFLSSR